MDLERPVGLQDRGEARSLAAGCPNGFCQALIDNCVTSAPGNDTSRAAGKGEDRSGRLVVHAAEPLPWAEIIEERRPAG
ncbi:MAG: hypothetical protein GY701_16485 [Sulfitobacter sp.]|nr:hypothetical protein [Sulfitobacter sp.]